MIKRFGYTYSEVTKVIRTKIIKFKNQSLGDRLEIILTKTSEKFSKIVTKINPDLIVIHGDRVEALACAVVGSLNHILTAHIEGGEVSGTIDEVGDGVTKFKKGDEVFGCSGAITGNPGALAEYQLVDERLLALKPNSLTLEECAALPLVSITAWDALVRGAKINQTDKVLVHGGAGGVGHLGVQLAKAFGADAYSTVSSDIKAELVRNYGATPINYNSASIAEYVNEHSKGEGFDVIFDTVGGNVLNDSFEASKLEGRVTSVNTRIKCDLTILHQKALSLHVVFMIIPILYDQHEGKNRHGEVLKEIAKKVDSGFISPLIHEQIFSFNEISEAHTLLEEGRAIGKVILRGFD